jgi:hypothetical protein
MRCQLHALLISMVFAHYFVHCFSQIPTDVRGLTFSRTPQMLLNILFLGEAFFSPDQAVPLRLFLCCIIRRSLCSSLMKSLPVSDTIFLVQLQFFFGLLVARTSCLHAPVLQATLRPRVSSSPTVCWARSTALWATTSPPTAWSPSLPRAPSLPPRCACPPPY